MGDEAPNTASDLWSDWLLNHRQAGDPAYAEVVRAAVAVYADRVLDAARLAPGMILADVGAGEGVVGFRAIDRIGPSLRCMFADVSQPMLKYAEAMSVERNVRDQCSFHECGADSLGPFADGSLDVVTTRAALAYVNDKRSALREFFRVLKPGGRISICEPILQDEAFYARALRTRIDNQGASTVDRFLVLLHRWKAAQFPDTAEACAQSPIVNYSERDLLNFATHAGFTEVHLQLEIDVKPSPITSWEVFLGSSPHPWAPSLASILADRFSPDERQFLEQMIRPGIESRSSVVTERVVYLSAIKPVA